MVKVVNKSAKVSNKPKASGAAVQDRTKDKDRNKGKAEAETGKTQEQRQAELEQSKKETGVRYTLGGEELTKEEFNKAQALSKSPVPLQKQEAFLSQEAQRALRNFRTRPQRQQRETKEQIRQEFQEQTGTEELRESIKGKIENQPSLKPEDISQTGEVFQQLGEAQRKAEISPLPDVDTLLKSISGLNQEQRDTIKGVETTSKAIAGLTAAGVAIAPAMVGVASSASSSFASSAGLVLGSVGLTLLGGGLTDLGSGKIDTARGTIQEMSEAPQDYQGLIKSGHSPEQAISDLRAMNKRLLEAEQQIKIAGQKNIEFRISKEYNEVEEEILTARRAILGGINAAENFAVTGQANVDPDNIMYYSQRLREREKKVMALKNE